MNKCGTAGAYRIDGHKARRLGKLVTVRHHFRGVPVEYTLLSGAKVPTSVNQVAHVCQAGSLRITVVDVSAFFLSVA